MSLIHDNKSKERVDGLVQHQAKIRIEGEKFADTFGPKAQRKRPKLAVSSLDDLAASTGTRFDSFVEGRREAAELSGQTFDETAVNDVANFQENEGTLTTAREPIFSKGQSKRIWNELYKVIDSSDVVIHVLDARDPLGTRNRAIEKYIKEEAPHKHLLFLLNKCDLVPTSVAARWVKLLSRETPTLAFHASLTNSFGKGSLISLLRQFSALHKSRKQISVGFIGYPNVGKSSIINTLRAKKVCTVAPIPGETKVWQYITLMKRIYLIDCPGCVPPSSEDGEEEILLRGVVRTENVEHPAQYIPAVLKRCQTRHIERTYDVKGWEDAAVQGAEKSDRQRTNEAIRFLEMIARKGGRLMKGGEADVDGVAKMVINDFLRGKIPWFVAPPAGEGEGKVVVKNMDGKGEGRDQMLGLKRKRGDGDDGESTAAPTEIDGEDEDEELEVESAEDEEDEEADDDFEGFEGDEQEAEAGVSLVDDPSASEDERPDAVARI
ncbi:GTPase required for pre-60S ribosomal subunit nuclear export and maturation [Oleoguttula sp. CCFEE 5521]